MEGIAKPLSARKGPLPKRGKTRTSSGRADNIRPTAAFVERYVLIVYSPPHPVRSRVFQLTHSECRKCICCFCFLTLQCAVKTQRGE